MRTRITKTICGEILRRPSGPPLRVGIDGVSASGKTFWADEIASALREHSSRTVIRASLDGFHNPPEVRYRRGKDSVEGYYEDSFNHQALIENLLQPLSPNGNGLIRHKVYDFRTESAIIPEPSSAPRDAILVLEGVFLFRPELEPHWDLKIFVDAGFDIILERALVRETGHFGSPEAVRERYQTRYIPGQHGYLQRIKPRERAHFVIRNDDWSCPVLLRNAAVLP